MADTTTISRKKGTASFSGGDTIQYNQLALVKEQEELRRLELENYKPALPTRSCGGMLQAQLETLGETMLELYDQVQELISASNKMLDTMGRGIEEADRSAAQFGG